MVVRRAEIKDIEKINELLLQVAMVHHYGRPDLFKANCRKYKNDELVEIIKDDNRPIFVAEDDGVVIGYAFCVITDRKDDNVLTDMKNLYIDDLCVDENMRDKHVGTVIYDYVKKYAKEIGDTSLDNCLKKLEQWENNPNCPCEIELYRDFAPHSFGFRECYPDGRTGIVGGLIYHGNPDWSYSVLLEPFHGWSIHT